MLKRGGFFGFLMLMCLAFSGYPVQGETKAVADVGCILPEFRLEAPAVGEEQEYLGLKDSAPFALSQVSGKLVIMEFTSSI